MLEPRGSEPEPEPAPGESDTARIVAPNPGPMTLEGTNTYLVGRDPAWVVDPGPAEQAHIEAVRAEAVQRGGIGGVVLTHGHLDHSEGVAMLGAGLAWGEQAHGPRRDEGEALAAALHALSAEGGGGVEPVWASSPGPESTVGPFTVVPTPGHAPDHVAFLWRGVCFCGDLILGHGSSIVPPRAGGGSLPDYLASLDRLEGLDPALLAPGHGPWIERPRERIAAYREHRLERERRLIAALESGQRSRRALLAVVWDDVPEPMLPAAALAMQAHLEKLAGEGRELGLLET